MLCYLVGLSRWCGAFCVASTAFDDATPIYADPDPFTVRFKIEPIHVLEPEQAIPIFVDEIWNGLSLTRDIPKGVTGWAVAFRGSLRSISKEDGDLVMAHLARQDEERCVYELTDRDKKQLARRANVPSEKGTVLIEVPDAEEEEALTSPPDELPDQVTDDLRQSLKVQAALARLGGTLGFKVWIAPGDRKKVAGQEDVPPDVLLDRLPFNYEAVTMSTIEQIDVIWIKGRSIARAFEVEHTTAIYSGLLRMADLLALQPNLVIKLHIVAPDDKREKVLKELRRPVFSLLENGPLYNSCTFLRYSSLDDITGLKHLARMGDGVLDDYAEHAIELA